MSRKYTTEEFKQKLKEKHGNDFILLSEYTRNSDKVKVLHTKCGNVIEKQAAKLIGTKPEGCYICNQKNHFKTIDTLQQEVDEKFPNNYKISGIYVNSKTKITVQNLKCGHTYQITPDNLLRGKQCAKCGHRQSSYMNIVENILNKLNIQFEKEKTFDNCVNVRRLPFDYYIPYLNACIEVDGEYHYITSGRDTTQLLETQKRDKIKTSYCQNNNIKLLRLPYFEKDSFEQKIINFIQDNTERG